MKKALGILGWTIAVLLFFAAGIIITNHGFDNMIQWAKLALNFGSFWILCKNIIVTAVYAFIYILGICLVIFSLIFAMFVIRAYTNPKKENENNEVLDEISQLEKDGYKEV